MHSSRPLLLLLLAGLLAAGCRVMPGSSPGISPPPSPSQAPAPASPTSGAPSVSTPGRDPVGAFFGSFAGDPPPYRVMLEVQIGGVSQGEALIDAAVDGADYHATVRIQLGGLPPRDSEIVFVDGTGYLREAGDEQWVVVPGYRSTPPLNPFLVLQPADYADEGADPAHGGLHHLSSDEWVEDDASLGYEEGGVRDVTFHAWLDERGVPVDAELDFALAGVDASGEQVALTYSARYVFSDVGAAITIQPPIEAPTASP